MTPHARVQVRPDVRRPCAESTFVAIEYDDDGAVIRVRGYWSGRPEDERAYVFPWRSIVAVRIEAAS
jgi:hypothetical protein